MGSRSGGDAAIETLEWRNSVPVDGHRRLVQVRLGGSLEDQDGEVVTAVLESILRRAGGRRPHRLPTDKGKELYNATFARILA